MEWLVAGLVREVVLLAGVEVGEGDAVELGQFGQEAVRL
jgi:hypothetical protein